MTVTPPVIANWSFEAQSVATNSYSITTPTSWSVAGPSGGAIIALIHPGTSDNRFGAGNVPAGMDGVNYCQVFMNGAIGAATVYQDLGAANQYQAGTTYTLTAAFGLERGNSPAGTLVLYNSALTPVATKTITPAMLVTNAATGSEMKFRHRKMISRRGETVSWCCGMLSRCGEMILRCRGTKFRRGEIF